MDYGKEATDLEALKKEIEALLNARLNFRVAVHLVPEGSLARFEKEPLLPESFGNLNQGQ